MPCSRAGRAMRRGTRSHDVSDGPLSASPFYPAAKPARDNIHLVTPEEALALPVLPPLPCIEELSDAVVADVVGEGLGLWPVQGRAEGEKAHFGGFLLAQ